MNRWLTILLLSGVSYGYSQDTLSVYFDVDQSTLSATELEKLGNFDVMNTIVLSVEGHCDTTASHAYNKGLSQRRVDYVLDNMGWEASWGKVFGETKAELASNYSHERFRRVDIVYRDETPVEPIIPPEPEIQAEVEDEVEESDIAVTELKDFANDSTVTEVTHQTTILFFNRSAQYLPESEPELQTLWEFLRDNPEIKAHIRGHICCVHGLDWDETSEGRARTVYEYLLRSGISQNRLTYKGYGSSKPFRYPERTAEDKKLNRRVDIVFSK